MKERYLAKSSMDRSTYKKINWQGFEHKNLDNIATVNFYGDSLYKSLTDWEESYDEWEASYESIGSNFGLVEGAPAGMCGDAKKECVESGYCETYNELKSFGICS